EAWDGSTSGWGSLRSEQQLARPQDGYAATGSERRHHRDRHLRVQASGEMMPTRPGHRPWPPSARRSARRNLQYLARLDGVAAEAVGAAELRHGHVVALGDVRERLAFADRVRAVAGGRCYRRTRALAGRGARRAARAFGARLGDGPAGTARLHRDDARVARDLRQALLERTGGALRYAQQVAARDVPGPEEDGAVDG